MVKFKRIFGSQNDITTEFGRGLLGSSSPSRCPKWGCLDKVAQDHFPSDLEYLQSPWNSADSTGNLFQCLNTLSIKRFVLIFKLHVLYFHLQPGSQVSLQFNSAAFLKDFCTTCFIACSSFSTQ